MMDLGSSPFTVSDRAQLGPNVINVEIMALEPQRLTLWVRLVTRLSRWLAPLVRRVRPTAEILSHWRRRD